MSDEKVTEVIEEKYILATDTFYEEIGSDFVGRLKEEENKGNTEAIVQIFLHDKFVEGVDDITGQPATFGLVSLSPTMAIYAEVGRFAKALADAVQGTDYRIYSDRSIEMVDKDEKKLEGKLVVIYNGISNQKMIDFVEQSKARVRSPLAPKD